jgi:hypothetical protein
MVSKKGWMSRSSQPRPQGCDLRKRGTRRGGVDVRRECAGKFGPATPCWSDSSVSGRPLIQVMRVILPIMNILS